MRPHIEACKQAGTAGYFPSFLEGLSLRPDKTGHDQQKRFTFPFLLGGAFIEADVNNAGSPGEGGDFPSFLEGLSLRLFDGE